MFSASVVPSNLYKQVQTRICGACLECKHRSMLHSVIIVVRRSNHMTRQVLLERTKNKVSGQSSCLCFSHSHSLFFHCNGQKHMYDLESAGVGTIMRGQSSFAGSKVQAECTGRCQWQRLPGEPGGGPHPPAHARRWPRRERRGSPQRHAPGDASLLALPTETGRRLCTCRTAHFNCMSTSHDSLALLWVM